MSKKATVIIVLLIAVVFGAVLFKEESKSKPEKTTCTIDPIACGKVNETRIDKSTLRIIYFQFAHHDPKFDQKVTIEDVEIEEGQVITFELHQNFEIEITIDEIKESLMSASFVTSGMVPSGYNPYEEQAYYSLEDDSYYWKGELFENECYYISSYTLDGGVAARLIFNVDECERNQICGWGKMLYMWEAGDRYEFGIIKSERVLTMSPEEIIELKEEPQTVKEVMEYMNRNECGRCFHIALIRNDNSGVRQVTEAELKLIKELYPELPFCLNNQTID